MKAYEPELQPLLEEIDGLAVRFESAKEVEDLIREQGSVDQTLIRRLESIEPEAISSLFPVASYTQESSQQNLGVSLESAKAAQFIIAIVMLGALSGALFLLVRMFQKDDLGKKREQIRRGLEAFLNNEKKVGEKTGPVDTKSAFIEQFGQNESLVADYIETHRPGGVVYDTVAKLDNRVENRIEDLNTKLEVLGQIIDKMYAKKGVVIDEMKRRAQKLLDDLETNEFTQQMQNVQQQIDQFAEDGSSHDGFLRNQVINDRNFASFALSLENRDFDHKFLRSGGRDSRIRGLIEKLQEKAEEMQHQRKADAGEKYLSKNVKHRTDAQGNAIAVFPELREDEGLQKLMKEIEMRVRYEIEMLTLQRRLAGHLLNFHGYIVNTRVQYQQFVFEQASE